MGYMDLDGKYHATSLQEFKKLYKIATNTTGEVFTKDEMISANVEAILNKNKRPFTDWQIRNAIIYNPPK